MPRASNVRENRSHAGRRRRRARRRAIAWPASIPAPAGAGAGNAGAAATGADGRRPQPRRPPGRGPGDRRARRPRPLTAITATLGDRAIPVWRLSPRDLARPRGARRRAGARTAPAHRDRDAEAGPAAVAHGHARRAAGGVRRTPPQRAAALRRSAGVGAAAHRARGGAAARDLRHRVHGASTWAVRPAGAAPAELAVRVALGVQRAGARPSRRPRLRQPGRRGDPGAGRRPRRAGRAALLHRQHGRARPRLRRPFDPGAHAADVWSGKARSSRGGRVWARSGRPAGRRRRTSTGRCGWGRRAWIRRPCWTCWRRRPGVDGIEVENALNGRDEVSRARCYPRWLQQEDAG